MTRMLACVTGPDEAEIALAGGADIIELKNPVQSAVMPEVIRATVAAIGGRGPSSAVAADLPMQPGLLAATVNEIAACGVDYVKLGLLPGGDAAACIRDLAGIAARVKLMAVFFADASPDLSLLPLLGQSGFAGAMIDTHCKRAGRLLDHFTLSGLRAFVEDCHAARLIAGLAGSLETPDIPRLLVLAPDLLGFRGALCGTDGRAEALDPGRVQAVRGLIPPEVAARETHAVDYRLLAARGYAPPAGKNVPVDRVFVDDLVLPVFIGAYAHERAAPQRVRIRGGCLGDAHRPRRRGHARRVLLRPHHRRHPPVDQFRPYRAGRDAGRGDRGDGAGASAGNQGGGAGAEAGYRDRYRGR